MLNQAQEQTLKQVLEKVTQQVVANKKTDDEHQFFFCYLVANSGL